MNIFKKALDIFKEDTLPIKSNEEENREIISIYHQIKRAVPDYDEPNYTLAEKVFREYNDFNLKNINEITSVYIRYVPQSLLPYPKNYIKCAWYLFMENAKKQNDLKMFQMIQDAGISLFLGNYPNYEKYKKNLEKKKWFDTTPELIEYNCREKFKDLYGVYEVSEEDYNSSFSSVDSTDEKLIHDFGVLPEIEEDVDFDKIRKNKESK